MDYIRKQVIVIITVIVSFTFGQSLSSGVLAAVADQTTDVPMGQSAGGDKNLLPEDTGPLADKELFGSEGGYFHPYLSAGIEFTDNLYNIDEGETTNLLTRISPGIWLALPRKRIIPVTINPNNSSPGGLQLQFEDYEGTDRIQAYALGGLDFKLYSEDSDLNATDGILEGLARYNMRGGLALQIVDRFTHGEDQLEFGSSTRNQIRRFDTNFFMATADWDITEKIRAQLDYSNFFLFYDDDINQFLDRVDNGLNLYGYYNYSIKTSLFLEYKYVDVAYDETTEIDNNSHFLYGGIKWNTTEKLGLLAKVGYQKKKFDDVSLGQEDFDGVAIDFQMKYRHSDKTLLKFDIYRTNEETDSFLATDKTVIGSTLNYTQQVTDRWSAKLDLRYEDARYSVLDSQTENDRDDTRFGIRPALQYLFREWLMLETAYQFGYRDSTEDFFDYESNTFIFNVNFAL